MFEKDLNVGYLLDFYGELLSERKRTVLDMYYNEDYSLSEVADEMTVISFVGFISNLFGAILLKASRRDKTE